MCACLCVSGKKWGALESRTWETLNEANVPLSFWSILAIYFASFASLRSFVFTAAFELCLPSHNMPGSAGFNDILGVVRDYMMLKVAGNGLQH